MLDIDFLTDLFSDIPRVTFRKMFGGRGVYSQGLMFALEVHDILYFKADAHTIPDFIAENMTPFVYQGKHKPVTVSYWQVPDRLFDEPEAFTQWSQKASLAAQRAAQK